MESEKFTIDEINFDEIYDLIDYDRTGSNSSSALENESPKLVPKSNPSAKLSTVNESSSKTGNNLIKSNHSNYAYDLPSAPPVPSNDDINQHFGSDPESLSESVSESVSEPVSEPVSETVTDSITETDGTVLINSEQHDISSSSEPPSPISIDSNGSSATVSLTTTSTPSSSITTTSNTSFSESVVTQVETPTRENFREKYKIVTQMDNTFAKSPSFETELPTSESLSPIRDRIFSWEAAPKPKLSKKLPKGAIALPHMIGNQTDLKRNFKIENKSSKTASNTTKTTLETTSKTTPKTVKKTTFDSTTIDTLDRRADKSVGKQQKIVYSARETSLCGSHVTLNFKKESRNDVDTPMNPINETAVIQDANSSNEKLMAMKNHHPTAKLSFSASPVTPPPQQNLVISQSRTPTNRQTSNNQQSNSQQSSPGGPNSVDSGNSSGKAHDLSHSSNSSTHSDEVQQNTMVRTTGNPENSRKNTPVSASGESSSKKSVPDFLVADVITLSLVRQCRDSWYRPNLSRDRAINMLKTAPFGAFIIRDSTSFVGGYGLAIRVKKLPDRIQNSVKPGMPPMDLLAEHVRHYLVESVETAPGKVGYQIKGNLLEPVYPNLDMLVYKHILEPISLPISLDLRLHTQHLPKTLNLLQNVKNSEQNKEQAVRSTVKTDQRLKKSSNASKTSKRSDNSQQSLQSPNLPEKTVKTTSFPQHVADNSESSSNHQLTNQLQHNRDFTLQNTHQNTIQKQQNTSVQNTSPPSFPVSIKQQKSASVSTTKNIHTVNEPSIDLNTLNLNSVNTLNSINSFGFAPSENSTMRRTASHNPQPSHALGTGIGRMTNTQTIYSCHLVYIGCRDCEKLAGPAAVERSLNTMLTNKKQNSSLIGFKIQKSGFTLTDEARKLFFRKHFNRKQLLTCDIDPKTRQLDVSEYSGLTKPAHLFGVVVQASGSQNQCHILAEVDQSVSTAVIVAKIRDFINEQKET